MCDAHNMHANARTDPSRTTMLRKQFQRELTKRFRRVRADIVKSLTKQDALGIKGNAPANPGEFAFPTNPQRAEAFKKWLQRRINQEILETTGPQGTRWTDAYIRASYNRGVSRAEAELAKAGYTTEAAVASEAFRAPIHAEALQMMYSRAFDELEGITSAMSQQINRELTDGLANGHNPRRIARSLAKRVDKVGISRAKTLARTEVIRAHHTANINEYERARVAGVVIQAEFSTAGDGRVCAVCAGLEGKTFTLQEVRGLIPVHPNCRCVALPQVQ